MNQGLQLLGMHGTDDIVSFELLEVRHISVRQKHLVFRVLLCLYKVGLHLKF